GPEGAPDEPEPAEACRDTRAREEVGGHDAGLGEHGEADTGPAVGRGPELTGPALADGVEERALADQVHRGDQADEQPGDQPATEHPGGERVPGAACGEVEPQV